MSKQLPYFRWYPADAETDENFRAMDDAEIGFYVRCLNHSWMNGGLPAEPGERARVLKERRKYADKQWQRVGRCFSIDPDRPNRVVNPRQEEERQKALLKSTLAKRSVGFRRDRHAQDEPENRNERTYERTENVQLRASESESVSVSDSESESFRLEKRKNGKGTVTIHWKDCKFNEFWEICWNKTGKDAARNAFKRKVDTSQMAERIITAARTQGPVLVRHAKDHDHGVLHPATWLNQGRYDDEGVTLEPSPKEHESLW